MKHKRIPHKMYQQRKLTGFKLKVPVFQRNAVRLDYKIYNLIWYLNLTDVDDHPSVPHAHSVEGDYRLNVWNGKVYEGNDRKNVIGQAKSKELEKLYKDKKFIEYAVKHIQWYREAFPEKHFYIPEWFEIEHMRDKRLSVRESADYSQHLYFRCEVVLSAEHDTQP